MIKLTPNEAQAVVNGLLACIPENYQKAFNALDILTKAPNDEEEKVKEGKKK